MATSLSEIAKVIKLRLFPIREDCNLHSNIQLKAIHAASMCCYRVLCSVALKYS